MVKNRRIMRTAVCASVMLAVYVGGYFLLPNYAEIVPFLIRYRRFPTHELSRLYAPMGWLECKLTKQPVCLAGPELGTGLEFDPGALW
jgi:hypothetical protein